jgi:hypothetical protein
MSDERYIVIHTDGGTIPSGREGRSYSVLDTALNHAEVFVAYAGMQGTGRFLRRRRAQIECDRRNQLEREWEASS